MTEEPDEFITCPECDAIFQVIWYYNPAIHRVEFCPFCGEELKEE